VIVEPVAANAGVILPEPGFLAALRDITRRHGALLVFDEVITGFRLALGGAQELFGIVPDLTTFGKIVGGGLPAAVYGGRAEVMRCVSPEGPVYQAGTLSGNPLATAAGLATLKILRRDPGIYARLADKTAQLAEAIRASAGPEARVAQIGSLMSLFFSDAPSGCGEDAQAKFTAWYRHLLRSGVYVAPSRFEAMFVSDAHTDADIERTVAVARQFFSGAAGEA